jgi:galactokinase
MALQRGDAKRVWRAGLDDSHRSMRDDFEVSTPEIAALVPAIRAAAGRRRSAHG